MEDVIWANEKTCFGSSTKSVYNEGNEIHFSTSVTKASIDELIKLIYNVIWCYQKKATGYVKPEDSKIQIILHIDSPGGSVSALLKFVDFCSIIKEKNNVELITIGSGLVTSAATIMCLMGDKRLLTKNCTFMIHELSTGHSSQFTRFKTYMKHIQDLNDTLSELYLDNSNMSSEEVETLLRKETWLTAEEALEYELVDEIVGKTSKKRKIKFPERSSKRQRKD